MLLTLLTATGARPEAWALCEQWMARQTYAGPVRWVIVDDGERPQPITFSRERWALDVIRPQPFWQPGQNTQSRNLLAGLATIDDGASLAVIEDDDWYAADWLDTIAHALLSSALVGEGMARYYNVATGQYRQLRNAQHASLCATAMRGGALRRLREICARRPRFIDLALWANSGGRLLTGHRVVGIKGLPGRSGIGMGHAPSFKGSQDADMRMLREWVGDDVGAYV